MSPDSVPAIFPRTRHPQPATLPYTTPKTSPIHKPHWRDAPGDAIVDAPRVADVLAVEDGEGGAVLCREVRSLGRRRRAEENRPVGLDPRPVPGNAAVRRVCVCVCLCVGCVFVCASAPVLRA